MNVNPFTEMVRSVSTELPGQKVGWLQHMRSDALLVLSENGFPHKKHEDWKYTNIQPLLKQEYMLPGSTCIGLMTDDIEHLFLDADENYRIVFINGRFTPQLSALKHNESGLEINSLAETIAEQPDVLQPYLAQAADSLEHGFNALNTAAINDGLYLRIHKNVQIKEPIHVLYLTTASDGLLVLPRNLIVLDNHAHATVVEHYASIGNANMLVDAMTGTWLAPGAALEHIKLQQESSNTTHIASHSVLQQLNSLFSSQVISTGGKLVRSDIHTKLNEEGAECVLNGLYLGNETQHMDFHTFIEHISPGCSSRQDYRGVLEDKARAVFNGRVYVHKDAQKTNADQSNKTLLLSNKAEMDTKPQLEIYADDVKCSHGATVGQLDENMLFYLRSRGISEQNARSFLVKGFVAGVLKNIRYSSVRHYIEQQVNQRLNLNLSDEMFIQ